MPLDMKKVKALESKIGKGKDDNTYLNQSKLPDGETEIRIMPPTASLNGVYCLEVTGYFINKVFFVCPSTFSKPSVIEEEVEAAKESGDADIEMLLEDNTKFSKKVQYWMPILHLEVKWSDDYSEILDFKIQDGKIKCLVAGPVLAKAINREVGSRRVMPDITDRERGFNITLTKSGKGLDTEYAARHWPDPMEMDPQFYTKEKELDVYKLAYDSLKSDDYLRKTIRNFLYGEAKPDRENKGSHTEKQNPKGNIGGFKGSSGSGYSYKNTSKRQDPEPEVEEMEEEEEIEQTPPPSVKKMVSKAKEPEATPGVKKGRNILNDLKNID